MVDENKEWRRHYVRIRTLRRAIYLLVLLTTSSQDTATGFLARCLSSSHFSGREVPTSLVVVDEASLMGQGLRDTWISSELSRGGAGRGGAESAEGERRRLERWGF